ncbi:MAG TPA: hypothetical protein VGJ72_15365 [Polaromonas sp.]|jgi:hypothetical protein
MFRYFRVAVLVTTRQQERGLGMHGSVLSGLSAQDLRALWLLLRKDGGWWTLDMLAPHWRPTCVSHEVQYAMDALEAGGFVESRDHATHLAYGITSDCEALPDFEPVR